MKNSELTVTLLSLLPVLICAMSAFLAYLNTSPNETDLRDVTDWAVLLLVCMVFCMMDLPLLAAIISVLPWVLYFIVKGVSVGLRYISAARRMRPPPA